MRKNGNAPASPHCHREHELAKEKGDFSWDKPLKRTIWYLFGIPSLASKQTPSK